MRPFFFLGSKPDAHFPILLPRDLPANRNVDHLAKKAHNIDML